MPFDEPTVDKMNFKSIFEGIKTTGNLTENTLEKSKSTLDRLDSLPISEMYSPKSGSRPVVRKNFQKAVAHKMFKIFEEVKDKDNLNNSKTEKSKTGIKNKYCRQTRNYRDYFFVSSFMNKEGSVGNFIKDHHFYVYDKFLSNYDISLAAFYKLVGKQSDGLVD